MPYRKLYRAALLHCKHWLTKLVSGVIVGMVALPLAMAFAIATGVKPEQGLYTAIIVGLLVLILIAAGFASPAQLKILWSLFCKRRTSE